LNPRHPARTLALAAIFQAARLAQDLARRGQGDKAAFAASIHSILRIDAASADAVYGGVTGVRLGLTLLRDRLNAPTDAAEVELVRYILSLIQLQRKLSRRRDMLDQIGAGIRNIETQMQFFQAADSADGARGGVHPRLVEKLAELYSQTISTLPPRIMVSGEHGHLSNPATAAAVRAALFAGIRAAVLWHQLGGRRWQLVFTRRRIAAQAGAMLEQAVDAV
jgi:high frequency lysogenization protein